MAEARRFAKEGYAALAVDLLARTGDRFPWERAIGGRYPLDRAGDALRDVEARRVVKALIVPE